MIDDADADYVRRAGSKLAVSDAILRLCGSCANASADADTILTGLFDSWSEVRADTANMIEKHQAKLPVEVQMRIANSLFPIVQQASLSASTSTSTSMALSWQKVHGALRGLHALTPLHLSAEHSDQLRAFCIALQGHARLPVREVARKCLLSSSARSTTEQQRELVASVLASIERQAQEHAHTHETTTGTEESESVAYYLEGLIQTLRGVLEQIPSLHALVVHSETQGQEAAFALMGGVRAEEAPSSSSGKGNETQKKKTAAKYILQRAINSLLAGMANSSSTVRQSAGAGLTALLLRCAATKTSDRRPTSSHVTEEDDDNDDNDDDDDSSRSDHAAAKEAAIALIHQQALSAVAYTLGSSQPDWRHLESCVLVADDVLRAQLTTQLHRLQDEGDAFISTIKQEQSQMRRLPKSFCCAAQDAIPLCLLHPKFEIRRVGSQLLPTLSRYLSIFEPELIFREDAPWVSIVDRSRWPDLWRDAALAGDAREAATGPNAECLQRHLVAFAWVSEVAKAQQHIVETLQQASALGLRGASASVSANEPQLANAALAGGSTSPQKSSARPLAQATEIDPDDQDLEPGSVCWALEVRGRLAEDEAKQKFHADLRLVLSGAHAKACWDWLNNNANRTRRDTVRLVSCLADCWRVAVGSGYTSGQNGLPSVAPDKSDPPTLKNISIVALDYQEATALACAILQDMGASAYSTCPDVGLSLTSDCTWVTGSFMLAAVQAGAGVGAAAGADNSHPQQTWVQAAPPPLKVHPPADEQRVIILPSVTDPTSDLRHALQSTPSGPAALNTPLSAVDRRVLRAANRWVCEAVAPVLPLLATHRGRRSGSGGDYRLGVIVSFWVLSCVGDALWLDHRPHVRRALFSSLLSTLPDVHVRDTTDPHLSGNVLETHIRLLVAATNAACRNGSIGGGPPQHRRDLGQQRGIAIEASEMGILAKCCRIIWELKKEIVGDLPRELESALKSSAEAALVLLRGIATGSRTASTRTSPVKAPFPLRAQTPIRDMHPLVCRILEGCDESPDPPPSASASSAPVSAVNLAASFMKTEQHQHDDNDDELDTPNNEAYADDDDGGGGGGGEDELLAEADEFSDWDDESEDELNVSSNSVQPLKPADGEVAAAVHEIELLLALL